MEPEPITVAEARGRRGAPPDGRKGAASRARILACAVDLSRRVGVGGISFGVVAEAAGLSKSAVVRHFGACSHLQAETLDALACDFRRDVLAPAHELSGVDRLRTLYGGFLAWMARGCPLSAITLSDGGSSEPLRARAAKGQAAWRRILGEAIADTVQCGDVVGPLDVEQVSFELTGAALVYRQAIATLGDEAARGRAWLAFERALPAPSH